MAAGFDLDAIEPLVSERRVTGRTLVVRFRCPETGRSVQARWNAPSSGVGAAMAAQAKHTAWYEARRQVNLLLRSVLGHGSVAVVATHAVNTAMHGLVPSTTVTLSAAEQEVGLVEAFRTVSSQFAFLGGRWVHTSAAKDLMAPFDAQLAAHPVTTAYDRRVLARMLVEVAAEGGLAAEEQLFLGDAIDPELGSLEALRNRPPLTSAELAETTAGETRVSILALVWSLALCDEALDQAETGTIDRFAAGLGLRPDQASRARDLARGYLVDQALERLFTWGEHDETARAQLYALGERLGMIRADVERAEARFQKRLG